MRRNLRTGTAVPHDHVTTYLNDVSFERPALVTKRPPTASSTMSTSLGRPALLALIACHMITPGTLTSFNGLVSAWIVSPLRPLTQKQVGCTLRHAASRQNIQMVTASTTASDSTGPSVSAAFSKPTSTAVVGGGPAGLATAIMLARRGYRHITVLERLEEPPAPSSAEWGNPERSYNLGIGGRGQMALKKLGAADRVLSWCADAVVR